MKKEVTASLEQKEKPIIYVQEEVNEPEDDKVLMKRFDSGEPAQKQIIFEEGSRQVQDQGHVLGDGRIRRIPVFTPEEKQQKKTGGPKKKDVKRKSAIQALGEHAERSDFLNSLARAPAGITFWQIANGDVDTVREELQKIIAKKLQDQQ